VFKKTAPPKTRTTSNLPQGTEMEVEKKISGSKKTKNRSASREGKGKEGEKEQDVATRGITKGAQKRKGDRERHTLRERGGVGGGKELQVGTSKNF